MPVITFADGKRSSKQANQIEYIILQPTPGLGFRVIRERLSKSQMTKIVAYNLKGFLINSIYGFVILKEVGESRIHDNLRKEISQIITEHIGPIAKLDKIQFTSGLPKTRPGKIMRRIWRNIACKDTSDMGDTSTLLNPEVVQEIIDNAL